MARAGETVVLPEREVTLHELTMTDWDGSDPDRPIAVVDVTCSAGTYVRAIARDLGESVGNAAYLGALTRTASGPFELAAAVPLDDIRAAAADGPEGLLPILRPIDDGLDAFPSIELTDVELAAVARGQYVRPAAGIPGHAEHYRLRAPDGHLAAIATADGLRLAPDKVFVSPAAAPPHPSARRVEVVQGIERLTPGLGPVFVVVGVFDGLHLGHAYLLRHLVAEAARLEAAPTVITFDHHPDEILVGNAPPLLIDPAERLERLAAAGVAVTVVQHFDEELRRTPYDTFVERIRRRSSYAAS